MACITGDGKPSKVSLMECLFCGQSVKDSDSQIRFEDLEIFCANLHRFVNYSHKFSSIENILSVEAVTKLNACVACSDLIHSFRKEYRLWEGANLMLQARIENLLQIIPDNRRNTAQSDYSQLFGSLRSAIIQKCKYGRQNAWPRVYLTRIGKNASLIHPKPVVSCETTKCVSLSKSTSTPEWLLSLAAVILLAKHPSAREVHESNCDDREDLESIIGFGCGISQNLPLDFENDVNSDSDRQLEQVKESKETIAEKSEISVLSNDLTNLEEIKTESEDVMEEVILEIAKYDHETCSEQSDSSHEDFFDDVLERQPESPTEPNSLPKSIANQLSSSRLFNFEQPSQLAEESSQCELKQDNNTKYNLRKSQKRTYINTFSESETEISDRDAECGSSPSVGEKNDSDCAQSLDSDKPKKRKLRKLHSEKATCSVCHENVPSHLQQKHFQDFHNVDDISPDKISHCRVPGCKAYFRTGIQRAHHWSKIHRTRSVHKRRGMYKCPEGNCKYRSATAEQLNTHGKLHGSFQCKLCPLEVSYAPGLPIHEATHVIDNFEIDVKKKPIKCSRCKSSLSTKPLLIKHFLRFHLDLSPGSRRCEICDVQLQEEDRNIGLHLQGVHGVSSFEETPPENVVHWDICPAYFLLPWQLDHHKIRGHWKGQCPECPYKSKGNLCAEKYVLFREHVKRNHPDLLATKYPFACTKCSFSFVQEPNLEKHIKLLHSESMLCSKCEKVFANIRRLKAHEKRIHQEPGFVCALCGKAFKAKHTYLIHMEYHKLPDEWKFQCDICEKRFPLKEKLVLHQRTHTKEKSYICQICGAAYGHRHNWRGHMMKKHPDEFQNMQDSFTNGKRAGNYNSRKGRKKGECVLAGVQQ